METRSIGSGEKLPVMEKGKDRVQSTDTAGMSDTPGRELKQATDVVTLAVLSLLNFASHGHDKP